MAILAFDRFETTLEAACSDTDTSITIPEAAAVELFALAGLTFDAQVWGDATQRLLRVPMYLDDGTHVERIMLPLPAIEGGPTPVERGTVRYAFAAGTPLRCSPSAEHVMQGHAGIQELSGVSSALVVPGECVALAQLPSLEVTLRLPEVSAGYTWSMRSHVGDTWPAEVLLPGSSLDAIAVSFKTYDGSDSSVRIAGLAGTVSGVEIPAGTAFALLRFRHLPIGLPPYYMRGMERWLVSMELWPS